MLIGRKSEIISRYEEKESVAKDFQTEARQKIHYFTQVGDRRRRRQKMLGSHSDTKVHAFYSGLLSTPCFQLYIWQKVDS